MRGLIASLFLLILLLQYPLWFGDNSLPDAWKLRAKTEMQVTENLQLAERNRLLDAEVYNLKNSTDVVEEKARYELGMVKKGETFYQLIEQTQPGDDE